MRSGRCQPADADPSDRGTRGDATSSSGKDLARFALAVAVPVALDDDTAFTEEAHGAAVEGPCHLRGQARGGGAAPDAGQRGAARSGKGDLAALHLPPSAAAFASGGGLASGGAGQRTDELGAADPGGVLRGDQLRSLRAEDRAGGGPGASDGRFRFLQGGFRPGPPARCKRRRAARPGRSRDPAGC